ncbi:MAG: hypothetical protein JW703_03410 [Candidatus Diapherotrites archaeon]|nr:hypothetical protein [Candidatus Diapherotrites archaeon]
MDEEEIIDYKNKKSGNEKKKLVEKADEDIYEDTEDEQLMEEDAIEPEEAGFMEGYNNPKDAKNLIKTERKQKK